MAKEPEVTIMRLILAMLTDGVQYLGFFLLALVGGFVSYVGKLRTGEIKAFKLMPLLIDMLGSGFAGIMVALLATSADLRPSMIYFLTGMAGHYGARTLFLLQKWIAKRLKIK